MSKQRRVRTGILAKLSQPLYAPYDVDTDD